MVHLFFDGARSDQAVDDHLAGLTDAPRTLARLQRGRERRRGSRLTAAGCSAVRKSGPPAAGANLQGAQGRSAGRQATAAKALPQVVLLHTRARALPLPGHDPGPTPAPSFPPVFACTSVEGFQSGSYSSTRLAPVRLTPSPPTRVVSRKQNTGGAGGGQRGRGVAERRLAGQRVAHRSTAQLRRADRANHTCTRCRRTAYCATHPPSGLVLKSSIRRARCATLVEPSMRW